MGGEPGRHQLRSKTGSDLQPRLLHRFSCRLLLQTGECLLYNAQKTEFKNIKMPLCGERAKWVGVNDAVPGVSHFLHVGINYGQKQV